MNVLRLAALSGILAFFGSAQAFSSAAPRLGATPAPAPKHFVTVNAGHFEVDGKPYYYVGTNFWYGMNLGAEDPARLERELDRLKNLGVKNLRIMASTQGPDGEPWRISPSLENSAGVFDEKTFRGLDRLLASMRKRDMRAVVCLNNFWPWSGGMSQYLSWNGAGSIPYPPPAINGSWDVYQSFADKFYSNEKAVRAAEALDRAIVGRINSETGVKYADDPTVMAWELANEPRGGDNVEAFNRWIGREAELLKSLDPHHLVTTGSEGETPWPAANGMDVKLNHSSSAIDYVTAHIWVQNWSWYDPAQGMAGLPAAVAKMDAYLRQQAELAKQIGKPLVLEEFGIGRDGASYDPEARTTVRDRYYGEVFGRVLELARQGRGSSVSGVNFWAWAGEARPARPYGGYWRPGLSFVGDPPHEAQGWYSIYDTDRSTQAVIQDFAAKLSHLGQ
jgi:mannan endo-1,4-beta-mannosidase